MQSSREIVTRALKFENPERIPRDIWILPYAEVKHPQVVSKIRDSYPSDIIISNNIYYPSKQQKGDPHKIGKYTDEWGCIFTNYQDGIIGEVKNPIITDLKDWNDVRPPYEQLAFNKQKAYDITSNFYANTDKFVLAEMCPRPWEQYQFLRGTENAFMDFLLDVNNAKKLLHKLHDYYMKELEYWTKADIDGIRFLDDWGAQNALLIAPDLWREIFKPLYKEYCDAIHAEGKFVFMHSDGNISDIYHDLIEIGVDAINSQLFIMDLDFLEKKAKGKITFWGEIDRQHALPFGSPEDVREAVRRVRRALDDGSGGVIAQCEWGKQNPAENIDAVFEAWLESR